MIKKLVAFVLLLTAGFVVLYVATGGESLARFGGAVRDVGQIDRGETPGTSVRVPIGEDHAVGDNLSFSYTGGLALGETRPAKLPDGTERRLDVYRLRAKDSKPLGDGTWELRQIEVVFFETRGPNEAPEAVEAGVLTARMAYVELGVDEEGRRSVAKDKDIDLFDAVLQTGPQARAKNLRLTIDRARVRSTAGSLHIETVDDSLPFLLEIQGDDGPTILSGLGLQADFPMNDDPERRQPASIEVARRPLLVHRGLRGASRLSAAGPLSYVEDPSTGIARVSAAGDVRVESAAALGGFGDERSSAAAESPALVAFGSRLHGTLRRTRARSPEQRARIGWRSLHLIGTPERPAGIKGQGLSLTCDAVDVAPNLDGEPWLFTARGQPALEHEVNGRTMHFQAAQRIHLIRLAAHWEPWLRGRGWSRAASSPYLDQLLVFEGSSSLTLPHGEGELALRAERGLRVLRGAEGTEAMTVLGLGRVGFETRGTESPLTVTGADGFRMYVDAAGQSLRLGPRVTDAGHRFELRTGELTAEGTGSCALFRGAESGAPGTIDLSSPNADIELTLQGAGGGLRQVATLSASFDATGVRGFDARGPACRLDWRGEQGEISGTAAHIHSTGPDSFTLEGAPATVDSGRGGTFEGRRIEVVRLSARDTVLVSEGAARLVASELPGAEGAAAAGFDLSARRIVYLPFVSPPHRLANGRWPVAPPAVLLAVPTASGAPHLIAVGDVVVQQLDEGGEPLNHAAGDALVFELSGQRGRLLGAPARFQRRDATGESVQGEAPVILLAGGDGQTMSLLPADGARPRFMLFNRQGPAASFGKSDGATSIVCDGPVDVDATSIRFGGPVEVTSIARDGSVDPRGFHLQSGRMHMLRDPGTGEIVSVHATHRTELRWRGIEVRAEELGLDLVRHRCTVIDRTGAASVRLPNRTMWGRCSRAEFDYLTYEGTAWHTWVTGDRATR